MDNNQNRAEQVATVATKSFAQIFKDRPERFPRNLEQAFPRVLAQIAEMWGTDRASDGFREMLLDTRGTRKGFPQNVIEEIYFLSELHSLLYGGQQLPRSRISGDAQRFNQSDEKTREYRRTLESRGMKFVAAEFFACVIRGDFSTATLFVNAGMDLEVRNDQGWTPLMAALFEGNEDVAQLLIANGANVNFVDDAGYRPIHWAAFKGYTNTIDEIVAKGGDVNVVTNYGWRPLLQAAALGHLSSVEALLRHGSVPDACDNDGVSALHKAASNNHTEIVRALVRGGADRDLETLDRTTALHVAARLGYIAAIEVLLDLGCSIAVKDFRGATPLHLAAANNHIEVMEKLLQLKSSIAAQDNEGATPLVYAIRNGAVAAARRLIDAGADIREIISDATRTAAKRSSPCKLVRVAGRLGLLRCGGRSKYRLHRYVKRDDVDAVKRLINKKVNVDIRDARGRTPLELAASRDNIQIWWLLVERGAGRSRELRRNN
jgi:ankyrin repeat protein